MSSDPWIPNGQREGEREREKHTSHRVTYVMHAKEREAKKGQWIGGEGRGREGVSEMPTASTEEEKEKRNGLRCHVSEHSRGEEWNSPSTISHCTFSVRSSTREVCAWTLSFTQFSWSKDEAFCSTSPSLSCSWYISLFFFRSRRVCLCLSLSASQLA